MNQIHIFVTVSSVIVLGDDVPEQLYRKLYLGKIFNSLIALFTFLAELIHDFQDDITNHNDRFTCMRVFKLEMPYP